MDNVPQKLAAALVAAQSELGAVKMDSVNPFLKNHYASLGACIDVARPILAKHGLAVLQMPVSEGECIGVRTVLLHTSGEAIDSTLLLPVAKEAGKSGAQAAGSVITYLRRYALTAYLRLYADEDTDGNSPEGTGKTTTKPAQKPQPAKTVSTQPRAQETDEEKLFRWKKLCMEAGGGKASYADEVLREVGHLLPTETLEDLHTTNLPKTKSAADEILSAIKARSGVGTPPANGPDFSEPFWGMICPIPRKGMKRDEYLKAPDTIRSLYEASHDDEASRNRLFGMVDKFTVSDTWVNAEGKTVSRSPASVESDKRWREALDQFKAWHDAQNEDVVP